MKQLKLTEEGAKKLQSEIEEKREALRELGVYKGSAAQNEGDTWHDNFAFEQTEMQERSLIRQINDLQRQLDSAEIIEATQNEDRVSIGSKVTILIQFSEDDEEELTFTLDSTSDVSSNVISINSPLGESIFEKTIGYEGSYKVDDNTINFKILSISK